jgi:hypothetical protein
MNEPPKQKASAAASLSLADCPQGFVPVVEEGILNFLQREIYVALVEHGAFKAQSVH